ncbi:hypothetical protein OTU49_016628, partial [Cherax quadricarinatus]
MYVAPSVDGRHSMLHLLLLTIMGPARAEVSQGAARAEVPKGAARAEVSLIHEGAVGGSAWRYSLLASTSALTWDEARTACEAVPGSMLARVEAWRAEAALEHYLNIIHFTEVVWLANRQTLPQVLEDEQREMKHVGSVGGSADDVEGDLTMGGDVGVTLRCAVYRVGVGVVHELCSAGTVSAALCVQRLSTERPFS